MKLSRPTYLSKWIFAIIVLTTALVPINAVSAFTPFKQLTQTELIVSKLKEKRTISYSKVILKSRIAFEATPNFKNVLIEINRQIETEFQENTIVFRPFFILFESLKVIPQNDEIALSRNI